MGDSPYTKGMAPTWDEERQLLDKGYSIIAGIDEVGRGTLAGPVTAAAVVLDIDANAHYYDHLRDSKRLSARQRERLAISISESTAAIGIGAAEYFEVDTLGIDKATRLAMMRAISNLPVEPDYLLLDAVPLIESGLPFKAIIRGDTTCRSIAAASIIAKVARDQRMVEEDTIHPGYGFSHNMGYATLDHLVSLQRLGPSPIHRRSFAPVRHLVCSGSSTPSLPSHLAGT